MKKIILPILLSSFLFKGVSFSQNSCGTYDGYLQDEINKYPLFYKSLEEKDRKLEEEGERLIDNLSQKDNDSELKIIPVVVHVIHNFGPANVTDADVHYALEQLNKNINRQADNMLTTPDVFAAVSGSANVEFRLAKLAPVNPDCDTCTARPTNGIIRVNSELTEVPVNEAGNNLVKTLSYWNSYSYFNIWVVTSFPPQADGNTLLGYAQFPWSGRMSTDGVAIKASEFKNGRTLTHEVGHWLGLRHIWGDNLCGDDEIFDTPVAKEENWNVPISAFPYNLNVCEADSINPAGEMFMNYMDYSDDNVMSLFTDGQVMKMNETLEGTETEYAFRKFLWSDSNLTLTGTADGFVGDPCTKEVDFIEQYGNTTTCVDDISSFKGNKNIFPSNASLVWDFGDGNTNSGDNTPNHSYTEDGIYDVTLTIEYDDVIVAKAYSIDDIQPGHDGPIETITETKIIEGTLEELNEVNATNITLHLDDSNYSIDLDTLFFRGEYQETYYLANYSTTCVSSITKQGFITVLPVSSSNTNDSYTFSFEEGATLEDDFVVIDNQLVSDWNFNVSANPSWERVDNISSHGDASIMINGKNLTSANPIVFETHSYDLEGLTEPAISFDYTGAAISSFPTNYLTISYSKECGVWKELETLLPEQLSSAGYYSQNFIPEDDQWNNIIMFDQIGSNDLQSKNTRFRFEYFVEGLSNRLYIDNIRIGEEADLLIDNPLVERFGFSVFPNPFKGNTNIIFETDKRENIAIKIFNILGSEVATILHDEIEEGYHTIPINLGSIEDGIYFISIIAEGGILQTNKIIVQ